MTNTERYNYYTQNFNRTWKSRLTWHGLDGMCPKNSISIINFERATNKLSKLNTVNNTGEFFNEIEKLSLDYTTWCQTQNYYDADELEDLRNFFKGAIGEYFFVFLLNKIKCLLIENEKSGMLERFDFDNVCPRLPLEEDYGVDLTGMVSHCDKYYPCVLQVKFWNPFSDTPITNKIAQSAHSDAIVNDFINKDDTKNIIICWLGNTKKVSRYLTMNEKLYKHIAFIDNNVLDKSINFSMPNFWSDLQKELTDIANIY